MFTKTLIAAAMMTGMMSAAVDAKPAKAEMKAQVAKTAELNRQQLASADTGMSQSQGSMGSTPSTAAPSTMTDPAMPPAGAMPPADMATPPATDETAPPVAPTPPQQ